MHINQRKLLLLVPLLFAALPSYAYIGPGAGAGTIAVVLGILASIVMAFFAILWYPVKRVIKKRKVNKKANKEANKEVEKEIDKEEDADLLGSSDSSCTGS